MTIFITFLTSRINPEMVYKINRVTDTVTFTLLVGAVPPTNLITEDFTFADEATAIAALNDFVAEARTLTIEEAIQSVAEGVLANSEITKGALKNINLGSIDDRIAVLVGAIVSTAEELVAQYETI